MAKKFLTIFFLFCFYVLSFGQLSAEINNAPKYLLRGASSRSTKGAALYNTKTEYTIELYNNAKKAGYQYIVIKFTYYKNNRLIKTVYAEGDCTFFPKQKSTCSFMVEDPNFLTFDKWDYSVSSAKGFDYEEATGDYITD